MAYIAGVIDGTTKVVVGSDEDFDEIATFPLAFAVMYDTHNFFDENVKLELSIFQKSSNPTPQNTILKMVWRDTYHNDIVMSIEGNLSTDENDISSIISYANALEEFSVFELVVGDLFNELVKDSPAYNPINTRGNKAVLLDLAVSTDKLPLSDQEVYEAIVEADETPNYLAMFFTKSEDLETFQTLFRVSEKLNIPLYVEFDPTLLPIQMIEYAKSIQAFTYRVVMIANGVISLPNNLTTLRGKRKPRYALGTIMGYMVARNSMTNAQGFAKLQDPIAGYNYPMRWSSMKMREDLKITEEIREMMAENKINLVLKEKFDTGDRFVLSDCLTQYDSETSVLRLSSSAEISMYIDNRLIQICKRHLLKSKETFKTDAMRECREFLEGCATSGMLVESKDLGGKYVLSITDHVNRPHDAVDLHCGYRPEGVARAVYLTTSVHK